MPSVHEPFRPLLSVDAVVGDGVVNVLLQHQPRETAALIPFTLRSIVGPPFGNKAEHIWPRLTTTSKMENESLK